MRYLLIAVLLVLVPAAIAAADTIELKSGKTMNCTEIMETGNSFVCVGDDGSSATIPKAIVNGFKISDPPPPAPAASPKQEAPRPRVTTGPPTPDDFQIVSHSGKWEFNSFYIIGEIKNIGTKPGGPKVEVIARDGNGTLIGSEQFWPNSTVNIKPGESCGIRFNITNDKRARTLDIKVVSVDVWKK